MARSIVSTQSIGLAAFSLLAIQLPLVNAVFLNSASDLPTNATPFDFIVVGSGPGGAVVASRLSENPQINVLLVEAGPSDEGVLEIEIPAFAATAPKTYEWNTTTVPVPSLNGRSVEFRRGHVLGGGSSINGLVYTRGSAELYDGWARMTGDNGWSWENIQRYIRKNEKWMHPNSRRNVSGEFNPAVHTFNGAVSASLGNEPDYLFDRLGLDSAKLQDEFTFNLDMNSGNALGLGFTQWTVGDGQRSSAATGYLNATVKARPNLTILVNTYVTRVLSDGTGKNIRKVEIGDRSTRRVLRTINARHEVIVSAGSIGTPQLLLNSGIGDATELKRLGIPAFHNLPDVGKYFRDHASMTFPYARTAQGALPPLDRAAALQQWQTSKTGPFSDRGIGSHQLLFARIAANSSVWKNHNDPAAGPNVPHMELLPVNADVPGGFNICGALLVIAQPFSSGTVGVRSSNPFDDPLVNPAYLAEQVDLDLYAEAIRLSKKFFTGPNWSTILGAPQYPDPDILSRADWEDAMRNEVSSGIHGVGGAIMSPRGSDYGVVDPDLKVKGLRGLRVVDASVMPHIPDGHTAVPTYIIAERASDLILQDWSLPV